MEKTHMPGEIDDHQQVRMLLAWYRADCLDPAEHAYVRDHLATCPQCQAELAAEDELQAFARSAQVDLEQDWSRLAARIRSTKRRHVAAQHRLAGRGAPSRPLSRRALWVGGTLMAQLALILVLLAPLVLRDMTDEYRVLGASPPKEARIIVAFDPQAAEAAVRDALTAAGARIVDGPTASGAYVLQTPGASRSQALATLRSRPEIRIAESLDPKGAP